MGKLFICVLVSAGVAALGWAQSSSPPAMVDLANLREDVRGLTEQVGQLTLLTQRVDQLERDNADLRAKNAVLEQNLVSVTQLNAAVADLTRLVQSTDQASRDQVAAQLKKLADQTNAALDALAKSQAARPVVQTTFTDDYAKDGVSYTVQIGDSITAIAKKTGAKARDIINANKIADSTKIRVGQKLFIPGGKLAPPPTP